MIDLSEQELLIKKGVGGEIGLLFGALNAKSYWTEMSTAYENSQGHKCSQCHNCNQQIARGEQNDHFTWKDDNTPSYICPKSAEGSEIVCHMCDKMQVQKKRNA